MGNIGDIIKQGDNRDMELNPNITPPKAFKFKMAETLEGAKRILWNSLTFVDPSLKKKGKFVNHEAYGKIASWMFDNKGKGLLLTGGVGVGKTTALRAIVFAFSTTKCFYDKFHRKIPVAKILRIIEAQDLSTPEYKLKERFCNSNEIGDRPEEILTKKYFVIDDLGTEGKVKVGDSYREPFNDIMKNIDFHKKMVVITSNLSMEEMIDRYDDRTSDRFASNFIHVDFGEDSMSLR